MIFIHMQCFIGGNFSIKVTCAFVILVVFDLKDKILTKEDQKLNDFKTEIIVELRGRLSKRFQKL